MARDKGTFFCARSKERRKSEGERERDPFTRPCIERLYSRLGFDMLELMISSSTGINSFSLLRAKYKPRLKERFNLIIFPVLFFGLSFVEQLDHRRASQAPVFASFGFRGSEREGRPLELVLLLASLPELATKNGYLAERIKRFGSRLISTSSAASHLRLISYHLFPSFLSFSRLGDFVLSLSPFLSSPEISRVESSERILLTLFLFDPLLGEAK